MIRSTFRTIIFASALTTGVLIFFSSQFTSIVKLVVVNKQQLHEIEEINGCERVSDSALRELIESYEVSKTIQNSIRDLQNPKNCKATKKVLCRLPINFKQKQIKFATNTFHQGEYSNQENSGFGSQAHLLTICFTIGFFTKRTVIIQSNTSKYSKDAWESFMLPISHTCTTVDINQTVVKVTNLSYIENLPVIEIDLAHNYIKLSDALPQELSLRIKHFHSNPSLWWAGQIALYVFKPTESFRSFLDKRKKELGIFNTFVGVHIRRTDKINEAKYINTSEYMKAVDHWYNLHEKCYMKVPRKVFLASDDPDVVRNIRESYPNYHFINDFNATLAANQKSTRYTLQSLKYIIQDIFFLSRSDFLVCTMSSNVCRLAYELMQTHYGNASRNVISLDRCYYIYGLTRYLC